jgi:lipopolysaccharide/colanic/teichoic acid biosynthesis glycosyltransferase
MSRTARGATPLIGRAGVLLVLSDVLSGGLALPAAAAIREFMIPVGLPLAAPEASPNALERSALWLVAVLSALLWPIALRAVDPGYPSSGLPAKRLMFAIGIWMLAVAGSIYLLDKDLESRALIVLAAFLVFGTALAARIRGHRIHPNGSAGVADLPLLGAASESALIQGEPIAISIRRLEPALPRPTVFYENGLIWIYPSVLSPTERLTKRLLDLAMAGLLIIVFAPLMLLVAIGILLLDGRPITYIDRRAGMFGRPFPLRKFRTMRIGADKERAQLWERGEIKGPAFKMAEDPRVTRLGRIVRRFSLDELPQLFDVIVGRMSLVGPRPAGLDEVARYEARHRMRLTVRPGVTGLWQVRRRIDESFEQRMSDDLEYIERWSILLDIQIALRTIVTMLRGNGV